MKLLEPDGCLIGMEHFILRGGGRGSSNFSLKLFFESTSYEFSPSGVQNILHLLPRPFTVHEFPSATSVGIFLVFALTPRPFPLKNKIVRSSSTIHWTDMRYSECWENSRSDIFRFFAFQSKTAEKMW